MSQESVAERQCYICLGSEAVDDSWVSPCRCAGTMGFVHQRCITRWVREQESHQVVTACGQCKTEFILIPTKSSVIIIMDIFYKKIFPPLKMIAYFTMSLMAADMACATLGIFAVMQVHAIADIDSLFEFVDYREVVEFVALVHLLSYSLLFISYLPWEDFVLLALRKSSKLPLLKTVLPESAPLRFQEPPKRKSWRRIVGGAVLLPLCANLVGNVFFSSVSSRVTRIFIGGAVFLGVQGSMYMYVNQKLLMRRKKMQILPFNDDSPVIL